MTAFLLRDELSSRCLSSGTFKQWWSSCLSTANSAFPGVPRVRTILRQIQNDWWIRFCQFNKQTNLTSSNRNLRRNSEHVDTTEMLLHLRMRSDHLNITRSDTQKTESFRVSSLQKSSHSQTAYIYYSVVLSKFDVKRQRYLQVMTIGSFLFFFFK